MKEAIGGVSLFQIVIVFLLVFTGIMALTINHSKAFGTKDEIINIIEKNSENAAGLSADTLRDIGDYLNNIGHRITGNCPKGENYFGYNRNGSISADADNAVFCYRRVVVNDTIDADLELKCSSGGNCTVAEGEFPTMAYYDIIVFYQLDIPIINTLTNFKLYGSTKILFGAATS